MDWTKLRERLLGEKQPNAQPPKLPLPVLPNVVMEFCRAAEQPNSTNPQLAQILERDAGLVVELLRNVNSATLGIRNKVNTSRAALSMLGVRRAKMFVLTSSVQSIAQKAKSPLWDTQRFSFAAMQRAIFARRLANRLGHDSELAFAGALLQDFVLPALTVESTKVYQILTAELSQSMGSLATLEHGRLGWDHALAGARLMFDWEFPDDIVCLVRAHHWIDEIFEHKALYETELVEVALSSLLPDPLDSRPFRQEMLEHHLRSRFDIDVPSFQAWVAEDLQYTGVIHDKKLAWTARSVDPV